MFQTSIQRADFGQKKTYPNRLGYVFAQSINLKKEIIYPINLVLMSRFFPLNKVEAVDTLF